MLWKLFSTELAISSTLQSSSGECRSGTTMIFFGIFIPAFSAFYGFAHGSWLMDNRQWSPKCGSFESYNSWYITYERFFSNDNPIVCTSSAQFSTKHFWWSEKKSFSQTNPCDNGFCDIAVTRSHTWHFRFSKREWAVQHFILLGIWKNLEFESKGLYLLGFF